MAESIGVMLTLQGHIMTFKLGACQCLPLSRLAKALEIQFYKLDLNMRGGGVNTQVRGLTERLPAQ